MKIGFFSSHDEHLVIMQCAEEWYFTTCCYHFLVKLCYSILVSSKIACIFSRNTPVVNKPFIYCLLCLFDTKSLEGAEQRILSSLGENGLEDSRWTACAVFTWWGIWPFSPGTKNLKCTCVNSIFAWTLLILSEYCNDIFPPVLLVETPNTSNAAWRHLLTDTIGHPRSSVTSVSGLCPPCHDFQCQAFTQALKDGKQRPGCAPRSCKWPRTRRVLILASGDTLLYEILMRLHLHTWCINLMYYMWVCQM